MKLVPYFRDRSNGARLTPQAAWQAEGCSWSVAAGGCAEAVLRARVNWANAAELAELGHIQLVSGHRPALGAQIERLRTGQLHRWSCGREG